MQKLPPEIIRHIFNDLPHSSLKPLRLCWRFLEPFVLPSLFHTVKVNFAEKHIKRLQGIALSPHLAPLVRQLIWITSGTRDTHDDLHGHVNTWTSHQNYIKEFRHQFFLCVDAMPNLHTFASELGPPDLDPKRDEIDGLVYALWPAMCRPQSRITSFRCQDPLNYMKWLNYEYLQAEAGKHTELPAWLTVKPLRHVFAMFRHGPDVALPQCRRYLTYPDFSEPPMTPQPSSMGWEDPLGKLLRLDLRADSAGGYWTPAYTAEAMLRYFLTQAVSIRELSLRFRPTGTYSRPRTDSKWMSIAILTCRWEFLHTVSITFAVLPNPKFFLQFMENHAATLKHILLHQCSSDKDVVGIIRGAAKSKTVRLHRFLVFPSYQGKLEAQKPRIIPERQVLDFINNKHYPPSDPFDEWMPSRCCNWGTVAQKAASIYEEWPDNGMHFICRKCLD
ncbi:hypothetical protein N0V84_002072 [Fusarium piperis]|uniref:F-box domain-containing protein n=1 Tax=Fusarium piperis TaxID=1435070 RepID=A0A9W9BTS0_9HYPO|nr:hypothetical protein N0V84_002072 [Fusarium piperis]